MATRVEVKSAPPTKSKFTDVNEVNSSCIRISPLSDSSNKTSDTVGTASPLIFDNEIKLSRTVGSATPFPVGTKPRLSPKPFSSDKTTELFRNVRPNLTLAKNSDPVSQSVLSEKVSGETLDANLVVKGSSSSDQILAVDKSVCVKESTVDGNTFFRTETKSIPEAPNIAGSKSYSEVKEERASQKLQLSGSEKNEVQLKPSLAITNVNSLPHPSFVPESNTGSAAKAGSSEKQPEQKSLFRTAGETLPLGVNLRTRSRPLSAVYSESPKEQKYSIETMKDFEKASGNATSKGSEKTTARKPRPLSTDLTSRFELKSPSLYRRSAQLPEESKENVPLQPCDSDFLNKKAELGAGTEEQQLDKIAPGGSDLRNDHRDDIGTNLLGDYRNRSKSEGRLEVLFKNKDACKSEDTKDISKQISKDSKYLSNAMCSGEKENERKVPPTSGASQKENLRNLDEREKTDKKEKYTDRGDSVKNATSPETSGQVLHDKDEISRSQSSGRTVQRCISLLLNSVNSGTNMTESSPAANEKEKNARIQQKIAELTSECTDPKPEIPRRSFQPRPLSADLTKKFSSQVVSSDALSEKSPESTGVSKERSSIRNTDSIDATNEHEKIRDQTKDDVPALKKEKGESSPCEGSWRRSPSVRISSSSLNSVKRPTLVDKHYEQEITGKTNMTNNDHKLSALFNSSTDGQKPQDCRTTGAAEDVPFKTVTAVIFDNTVERHAIDEKPQRTGTQTNLAARSVGNYEEHKKVKKKQETDFTDVKHNHNRHYGQLDSESGSRQLKRNEFCNKKESVDTQDNKFAEKMNISCFPKDSWNQRIEPQLYVFHTNSEKAVSEYVPVAAEDKATALRSRRSFNKKERVKPDEKVSSIVNLDEIGLFTKKQSSPKIGRPIDPESTDPSWISVHAQQLSGGKYGNDLLVDAVKGNTVEKLQVFGPNEYWEVKSTYTELDSGRKSSRDSALVGWSAAEEEKETVRSASDDNAYIKSTGRWRKTTTSKEYSVNEDERLPAQVRCGSANVPMMNVVTCDDIAVTASSKKSQDADKPKTANQDMRATKLSENVKSLETTANEPGKHDSPHQPKATYFAVTYHLSDSAKDLDYMKPSLESSKVGSVGKYDYTETDVTKDDSPKSYRSSIPSKVSTSKIASPKYLDDTCCEQDDSKNTSKKQNQVIKEYSKSQKRPFPNKPNSSVMADNSGKYTKSDVYKQRGLNVDSVTDYKKNSFGGSSGDENSEMKTSPHYEKVDRNFKVQELAYTDTTMRKPGGEVGGVLDIDALMAKYRREPLPPSDAPVKSYDILQESSFDQQKSKSSSLSYSHSYDWNEKGETKSPKQKHYDVVTADESYNQSSLSLQSWKECRKSRIDSSVVEPKKQNKSGDSELKSLCWTEYKDGPLADKPNTVLTGSTHVSKTDYANDEQKRDSVIEVSEYEKYDDDSPRNERLPYSKADLIEVSVDDDIPYWNKKKPLQNKDIATKKYNGQDVNSNSRTDWKEFSVDHFDSEMNYRTAKYDVKSTAKPSNYLVMQEVRHEEKTTTEKLGRTSRSIIKRRQSMPRQLSSLTVDNKDVRERSNTMTEYGSKHSVKPSVKIRSRSLHREETSSQHQDQLRQCLSRPSSHPKDTESLVQQTDGRYGTWESDNRDESVTPGTPSADPDVSPVPSSRKQTPSRLSSHSSRTETTPVSEHHEDRTSSLDRSSIDMDSTDGTEGSLSTSTSAGPEGEAVDFTFLDQTPVLDSSAQKNRLQLSRKRTRRAPTSHSMRKSGVNQLGSKLSAVEEVDGSWMFKDSTEEKSIKQESDEETTPRRTERSPVTQTQRIPVLPVLDTSAVKLRKRPESCDSPTDTANSTPSKSPKVPLHHGSVRVLPPAPGKGDGSEEKSPPWMKELKSKKRQSLHESRPL